jgi:hypothetical protein
LRSKNTEAIMSWRYGASMREGTPLTKLFGVLVGVAITIAGCGDGGGSGAKVTKQAPSSTSTSVATAGGAHSEDELAAALLAIGDFPSGWSEVALDDSPGRGFCGKPLTSEVVRPAARAERRVAEDPDTGPLVNLGLMSFETGDNAHRFIETAREAGSSCQQWEDTVDGERIVLDIGAMSFPAQGDQTYAVKMTVSAASDPDSTYDIENVGVQLGNVVVLVQRLDLFGTGEPFEELVTKAVSKARATLGV